MFKRILFSSICMLMTAYLSCEHSGKGLNDPDPQVDINRDLSISELKLVESDNKFSFKLFEAINRQEEPGKNLFISPLSVSMALGMTLNGADGTTRDEMESALELAGLSPEEINESYKSLTELLTNLDKDVLMQIANSIWYNNSIQVEQDFVDVNKEYFDAEVTGMDFADPSAPLTINNWVSDKTHGKITKIAPNPISDNIKMFLINAIYFNGSWKYQFDPEDTEDRDFLLSGEQSKTVSMMSREGKVRYFNHDRFLALDLPYGNEKFYMTVILPSVSENIDDIISILNPEDWNTWMSGFHELDDASLYLPKFKLEYKLSLVDVLKSMGMEIAFSGSADFSKITNSTSLFISDVLHKTFVEVNEEGTTAAAVTSVVMTDSLPPSFTVDRPFIFVIREDKTGAIVFMGKILDPEYE